MFIIGHDDILFFNVWRINLLARYQYDIIYLQIRLINKLAMPSVQSDLDATDFQMTLTLIGPTFILAIGPLISGPVRSDIKIESNY